MIKTQHTFFIHFRVGGLSVNQTDTAGMVGALLYPLSVPTVDTVERTT